APHEPAINCVPVHRFTPVIQRRSSATGHTATGALKDDLSLGMKRKESVLFSMYREKTISQKEYEEAKAYDLKKDFLPTEQANGNTEGYLYYTVLDKAVEI
ncbi:hypothetical protein, partial [Cronobacter malonaticus]|uniref:hypothetical protein n=1 Tax=Cronobacter malonaticus TaxID=413503 RepID=UPI001C857228